MTDTPLSGVLPRRRPTTYAARPGFTPTARPGDSPQPPAPRPDRAAAGPEAPPAPPAHHLPDPDPDPDPALDLDPDLEPGDLPGPAQDSVLDGENEEYLDGSLDVDGSVDVGVAGDVDGDVEDNPGVEPADVIEVLYPPTGDPFDASLVLAVEQPDLHVAVGARLNPLLVAALIEQLLALQDEQHQAMGLTPPHTTDRLLDTDPSTDDGHEDPDENAEGLTRRVADPLGLRHLRERSPKATAYLAYAIGALLVLSLLINHLT